jgi:hypothetical protein
MGGGGGGRHRLQPVHRCSKQSTPPAYHFALHLALSMQHPAVVTCCSLCLKQHPLPLAATCKATKFCCGCPEQNASLDDWQRAIKPDTLGLGLKLCPMPCRWGQQGGGQHPPATKAVACGGRGRREARGGSGVGGGSPWGLGGALKCC